MNLHPIKILLLDDDQENIQHLQQFFIENKVKNEFYALRNGAEALIYLRRITQSKENIVPHLILVSNTLKLNDRHILDRVTRHPKLENIPAIILFKCEQEYAGFMQNNAFNKPALLNSFTMESLVHVLRNMSDVGLTIARAPQSATV